MTIFEKILIMENKEIKGLKFQAILACFISLKLTFTTVESFAKEKPLKEVERFCLNELSKIDLNINNFTSNSYIEIKDEKFNLIW
jgi:hypothetical protein